MNRTASTLIARAKPLIAQQRARESLVVEASKGCLPDLFAHPVSLEPPLNASFIPFSPPVLDTRLQLWLSPDETIDWLHCETFIKQLAGINSSMGFEITGNRNQIIFSLLCSNDLAPLIEAAFLSQFPHCRIRVSREPFLAEAESTDWSQVRFMDYFPPPPYSHLFTTTEELCESPLKGLLHTLSILPPESHGFYQCLFQPVHQHWHNAVEMLTDIEYQFKLQSGAGVSRHQFQQTPSGDLRNSAMDVENKAHNDKPFFSVAVRAGLFGSASSLDMLNLFMNLFQHGGKPLQSVHSDAYHERFGAQEIKAMFQNGQSYRSGFLLNSRELTGLVHPVSYKVIEDAELPLETLDPITMSSSLPHGDTILGYYSDAGIERELFVSDELLERGTHQIGVPGCGKTTLLISTFLQSISQGIGAVFIDPHGDAINDIMRHMSEEHIDRCIHFDPSNQEHVPLWNPLYLPEGACRYRMADDLLSTFERVFTGWGDRLAHVLRNGLIGLSYLESPCLLDLYHLLRQKSKESERIRKLILAQEGLDEPIRRFWEHDFLKDYRESELAAPKHKLSKLISGSVGAMFSQSSSAINLQQIMDENKILLVDLSGVGADTREVLGSLMLTLFMMTALARSKQQASERTPFSIFADECHMFVSADAIEQMIVQARKFKIRLSIAHQYLAQFSSRKVDGLSTTGTTIIGRVNKDDSYFFSKQMRSLVKPEDLLALPPFTFVARLGTELARFKTRPLVPPELDFSDAIVSQSRKQYCASSDLLNKRRKAAAQDPTKTRIDLSLFEFTAEDFVYDEF